MKNGFEVSPLQEQGSVARLFKGPAADNAFIEVENLLATKEIAQITSNEIESILARYKIRPLDARTRFRKTFAVVLSAFAKDLEISDSEAGELRRLRDLLGLTDADVSAIELQIIGGKYSAAVDAALADRSLTQAERDKLDCLRRKLRLDDRVAQQIYRAGADAVARDVVNDAVADRKLSPEEDAQIKAVCENLGVKLNMDGVTLAQLQRYRAFWKADQGEFSGITVSIQLEDGEKCFYSVAATQHEFKTETDRANDSEPNYCYRIAKGRCYQDAAIKREPVRHELLQQLDSGAVYFTTRRIFFRGTQDTSLPLQEVARFEPYADGIRIEKDTGKDQFFMFKGDIDFLNVMLDAAIRWANQ